MTDGININVTIEELHVHYPDVEADDIEPEVTLGGVETEDDETRHGGGSPGPRPGGHDKRDKPIKGLIMLEVAGSEGATPGAIAEILDANKNTVRSQMRTLHEYRAFDKEVRGGHPYYTITEFGERVLSDYKERWNGGYANLPGGYWEGIEMRSSP